ncbi:MAG: hypothetical protein AAF349_02400 [Cyanobacteria bacterium P01_A01_bin.68]
MPRLPECDRCLLYAHDPHLVCAVHPSGPGGDSCLDFREDPSTDPLELWEPQGARYIDDELVIERTYYNGEEIRQPQQRWTREEQLELLNTHPIHIVVVYVVDGNKLAKDKPRMRLER